MSITKISVPLKEASGYYNEGTTIPAATNTDGDNALQTGQTNGALAIVVTAATAVAIADAATVTLTVTSSATEGGTYTAVGTSSLVTASGSGSYDVDDAILSFILPADSSVLEWTKVNLATDDATATGTYNIALRYIAQ